MRRLDVYLLNPVQCSQKISKRIQNTTELLAHRFHEAKHRYLNGLLRHHHLKWCQMPLCGFSESSDSDSAKAFGVFESQAHPWFWRASFCPHSDRLLDLDSETMRTPDNQTQGGFWRASFFPYLRRLQKRCLEAIPIFSFKAFRA